MILVIGAGLVGKSIIKSFVNRGLQVVCVDPFVNTDNFEKFIINEIDFVNSDFENFTNDEKYHNIFDAIINVSYPVKRDMNSKVFPKKETFSNSINNHISLYYNVMLSSKNLLKDATGSVVSASSIYSTFMPRPEIYKDSSRCTPIDYVASKSAIIFMSKFFAKNFSKNIYFNTISFGGINNNHEKSFIDKYGTYTKSKKMIDAKEISESFLFMSNAHINKINGENLVVDDGFSL
tara:strand:- start:256 stop:960 length:705 start_codon:yes stop_codon:yes gene_type:complete